MEEKQNKRKHFNIIDVLIILVLAAGIAFLVMQYTKITNPNTAAYSEDGEKVDVYFEIHIDAVQKEVYEALKVGDRILYDLRTNGYGEICEIYEPQLAEVHYTNTEEGKFEKTTYPDQYDISFLVKTEGYENDEKITIGSYKLTVGTYLYLKTANVSTAGYVFDVRTEKGGSAE